VRLASDAHRGFHLLEDRSSFVRVGSTTSLRPLDTSKVDIMKTLAVLASLSASFALASLAPFTAPSLSPAPLLDDRCSDCVPGTSDNGTTGSTSNNNIVAFVPTTTQGTCDEMAGCPQATRCNHIFKVGITDEDLNPIPLETVDWEIKDDTGSQITAGQGSTNAEGNFRFNYRLGCGTATESTAWQVIVTIDGVTYDWSFWCADCVSL